MSQLSNGGAKSPRFGPSLRAQILAVSILLIACLVRLVATSTLDRSVAAPVSPVASTSGEGASALPAGPEGATATGRRSVAPGVAVSGRTAHTGAASAPAGASARPGTSPTAATAGGATSMADGAGAVPVPPPTDVAPTAQPDPAGIPVAVPTAAPPEQMPSFTRPVTAVPAATTTASVVTTTVPTTTASVVTTTVPTTTASVVTTTVPTTTASVVTTTIQTAAAVVVGGPTVVPPAPGAFLRGAYIGNGGNALNELTPYEGWFKRKLDLLSIYDTIGNSEGSNITSWRKAGIIGPGGRRLEVALGMDDLDSIANGSQDADLRSLASFLVDNGLSDAIIRAGWEMNGNWFNWSAGGREALYVSAFQRVVTEMRSVAGQHFAFSWCANNGSSPNFTRGIASVYPGDAYVDIVALDIYDDTWSGAGTPEQRWVINTTQRDGLATIRALANDHGKPMGIGEWGVSAGGDHSGGDNPYFIDKIAEFIADQSTASGLVYESYFEFPGSGKDYWLRNNDALVNSQREYVARFGG